MYSEYTTGTCRILLGLATALAVSSIACAARPERAAAHERASEPRHPSRPYQYRDCASAVGARVADERLYRSLIDDFTAATENTLLVVNAEATPEQFTLLLPDANLPDAEWPADQCRIAPWPPNCRAEPAAGSIICNPAMTGLLTNHRLHPPSAAATIYAERFVAYFVLGHELAHLRLGKAGSHAALNDPGTSLKCRPAVERSLEVECDAAGLMDARSGVLALPWEEPILSELRTNPLQILTPLEHTLDLHWFPVDDTCLGDVDYPSMMRRKFQVRDAYVDIFGGEMAELAAQLHRAETSEFLEFEAFLRGPAEADDRCDPPKAHQLSGFASSPRYGLGRAGEQTVVWGADLGGFVSYDSGTSRSSPRGNAVVYFAATEGIPQVDDRPQFKPVHRFEAPVDLLHTRVTADAVELYTTELTEEGKSLVRLQVVPGPQPSAHLDSAALAEDTQAVVDERGRVALVETTHVRLYPSFDDFVANRPRAVYPRQLAAQSDELVSFAQGQLIVATLPEVPGLFAADVFSDRTARNAMFVLPDSASVAMGATPAIARVGSRVLFAQEAPDSEKLHLVECPAAVLEREGEYPCLLHQVSEWSGLAPAYVTRDLGALQPRILAAPTACGSNSIEVRMRGLTWLFDPDHSEGTILPGSGLVSCSPESETVVTWRSRRIDVLAQVPFRVPRTELAVEVGIVPIPLPQ